MAQQPRWSRRRLALGMGGWAFLGTALGSWGWAVTPRPVRVEVPPLTGAELDPSTALDPASWGKDLLGHLWGAVGRGPKLTGRGPNGAVTAQHPLTSYAGLQALRGGGSAADAVVAMSALDNVLWPGTTLFTGPLTAIYHQTRTGQTHALNALYASPLEDTEPYTHAAHRETGRSVLVPGLVAGLEALWQRHGRLPWRALWQPAIHFARNGFPIYGGYLYMIQVRKHVLLRHPEGRAIFAPDGALPKLGDLFRQPQLAETLDGIARDGVGYFYRGQWAEQAVAHVRQHGGKLSREDLARYEARWDPPVVGRYLDYEIRASPPPAVVGPRLIMALNVAEALDLHRRPPREWSARTLYEEIQIDILLEREQAAFVFDPDHATSADLERLRVLLSKEHAATVAAQVRAAGQRSTAAAATALLADSAGSLAGPLPTAHTHVIGAADAEGNLCSATHSCSGEIFGEHGLFVGGMALNSSAASYAPRRPPPGGRVQNGILGYVVLKDGKPLFAAGAAGRAIAGNCFQTALNILAHGRDLEEAIAAPRWHWRQPIVPAGSVSTAGATQFSQARIVELFDRTVLDEVEQLGQRLHRAPIAYGWPAVQWMAHWLPPEIRASVQSPGEQSGWGAVGLDPATNDKLAVTEPRMLGLALAY